MTSFLLSFKSTLEHHQKFFSNFEVVFFTGFFKFHLYTSFIKMILILQIKSPIRKLQKLALTTQPPKQEVCMNLNDAWHARTRIESRMTLPLPHHEEKAWSS